MDISFLLIELGRAIGSGGIWYTPDKNQGNENTLALTLIIVYIYSTALSKPLKFPCIVQRKLQNQTGLYK